MGDSIKSNRPCGETTEGVIVACICRVRGYNTVSLK